MTTLGISAATAPARTGILAPVVFIPGLVILCYCINAILFVKVVIPINFIGGFTYRIPVFIPAAVAVILGVALSLYNGTSVGKAILAAIFIFVLPLAAAFGFGFIVANYVPLEVAAMPANTYLLPFVQTAVSDGMRLLVLTIAMRSFRSWAAWIVILGIFAGGATLLFWFFKLTVITGASYPALAQNVRFLGFIALACWMQPARR